MDRELKRTLNRLSELVTSFLKYGRRHVCTAERWSMWSAHVRQAQTWRCSVHSTTLNDSGNLHDGDEALVPKHKTCWENFETGSTARGRKVPPKGGRGQRFRITVFVMVVVVVRTCVSQICH